MQYPKGWYCAGRSEDFPPDPKQFTLFNKEWVSRRVDGELIIHQNECPHMGASLAGGECVGERIKCPYHEWEFDRQGIYQNTGYARLSLKLHSLTVFEVFDMVFVYNNDYNEEGQKSRSVQSKLVDHIYKGIYTKTPIVRVDSINTNWINIFSNVGDVGHFASVHGFPQDVEQSTFVTDLSFTNSMLFPSQGLSVSLEAYGPGMTFINIYQGDLNMTIRGLGMTTPVTDTSSIITQAWVGAGKWKDTTLPDEKSFLDVLDMISYKVEEDFPVWNNLPPYPVRPMYTKSDKVLCDFHDWVKSLPVTNWRERVNPELF
jgi:phenylpropionate dioxygenase-like ring-hydroxylating dioxygenase large terminal subunit